MPDQILTPLTVRKWCLRYASQPLTQFDDRKFGAAIGHLNEALKQLAHDEREVTEHNRRLVQAFLFTPDEKPIKVLSASGFTFAQRNALYRWVGSRHNEQTDKWYPRSSFKAEANWILNLALWFYVLSLQQPDNPPSIGTLIAGYKIEAGLKEDQVTSDHWLQLALEQPGVILTKIYE